MKTYKNTEEKVYSYIREQQLLEEQDRVLLGVSGGADSVCLLFVLHSLASRLDLSLGVVHVNHSIRPDAGEDAAYVEELCRQLGVPFFPVVEDVPAYAGERSLSLEEAGREVRYLAFERTAEVFGAHKIAVAHNANDRAETMLFHLFRGSDLRGLGSIRPSRGRIVRPLLCLERQEIEDYLTERGIRYCQDSTNGEDDYTRNRIRHHILPFAEKEIVEGSVSHMCTTADSLAEIEEYLAAQTLEAAARVQESPGVYRVEDLLKEHPVIQKRLIYEGICGLAGARKDLEHVHVYQVLDLFAREGNRTINLPGGVQAERSYHLVTLYKERPQETGGSICTRVGSCREILGCDATGWLAKKDFSQKDCTKYFDYDKIKGCPVLRTREKGDYLAISDGNGGIRHKSLKDYMITEKIPRALREEIPVFAIGSHVLWLVGYRISEDVKITESTENVLQVDYIKKCHGGGETEG